jgi:hypothetical protein
METLILKKTRIGDLIINNNVAPNNVLVGDTWINLFFKIVKESTLLLTRTKHTNNHLDHHIIS